jgi:hypothetical protein
MIHVLASQMLLATCRGSVLSHDCSVSHLLHPACLLWVLGLVVTCQPHSLTTVTQHTPAGGDVCVCVWGGGNKATGLDCARGRSEVATMTHSTLEFTATATGQVHHGLSKATVCQL